MVSSALPRAFAPSVFTFEADPETRFDVRVVMIDDEPWFYAADVCAALSLGNTAMAVAKLDDDEKSQVVDSSTINSTDGGEINNLRTVLSESGLYTLVLRCRDAVKKGTVPHKFRKWVTAEVLPSIRKTGSYQLPKADPAPTLERITSAQMHQLGHIVQVIEMNFHAKGSASHAAYGALRKQFGLERGVTHMPSLYFDQAVQILTEIERLSFALKGIVLDVERRFCRDVIRGGQAFNEQEWLDVFEAELAQLIDDRRQALKLLG